MAEIGRILLVFGVVLAILGLILTYVPGLRLGRLPGDFTIELKGGRIYVPLATCALLSVAFSLLLWLVAWLRK
jgi:hypothetical protein